MKARLVYTVPGTIITNITKNELLPMEFQNLAMEFIYNESAPPILLDKSLHRRILYIRKERHWLSNFCKSPNESTIQKLIATGLKYSSYRAKQVAII